MTSLNNTEKLVQLFLEAAKQPLAYNTAPKALFHKRGKALLQQIARDLGYSKDHYDLRSNMAGIAVSGEITLHTDDLYIQFSQSCGGRDMDILYRDCEHRCDYTGGRNRFMRFDALLHYESALARFAAAKQTPITIIDIGDMVLCDLCNADYTDSDAEGGVLMGTYSICPTCAPGIIRDAERFGEPFVRCPAQTRFKDWVLQLRGGRNTIEITAF